MPDQRHFHRIDFVNKADFTVDNRINEAFLVDISLKGAMVEFPQLCPVPMGSRGQLTVKLNNSEVQLDFEGEVVHVHGAMAGIKFIRIDIDTMIHLRRLLELNYGDAEEIRSELHELLGSNGRE